jgi:hypothetical protein
LSYADIQQASFEAAEMSKEDVEEQKEGDMEIEEEPCIFNDILSEYSAKDTETETETEEDSQYIKPRYMSHSSAMALYGYIKCFICFIYFVIVISHRIAFDGNLRKQPTFVFFFYQSCCCYSMYVQFARPKTLL